MAEEINIKLKADTSGAVKSVKELEQAINGIDKIRNKGKRNDGVINENDVKNFKRLADQMNQVYRDFYNELNRTQRKIDAKKREMDRMTRSGVNKRSPMYQRSEREVNDLEKRRDILENNRKKVDKTYVNGDQKKQQVDDMRVGGSTYQYINHHLKRYGGILGVAYGASKIGQFIGQGANLVTNYNNQLYPYAQQVGGYYGDFDRTRSEVANAGAENGYTVGQSLSTLYGFTGKAGTSAGNPIQAMKELQAQSRAMGLDSTMLAGVEGGMAQSGAHLNPSAMRQWAYMITGAVDKTKMAGRQQEMVQAFSSLQQENSQGMVNQSFKTDSNLLGYQTMLGSTGLAGFKGQAGANFLMNVDQGIKNASPQMQLLEGLGTSTPATLGGKLGLQLQMEKGIGDPSNLSRVLKNVGRLGTSIKDPATQRMYRADILKKQFSGTTMTEWNAILSNPQLMKDLEGGQVTLDQVEKGIKKDGAEKFNSQYDEYRKSWVGKDNQGNANKEKSQQDAGGWWSHLKTGAKSIFFGMPEPLQWGLGAGGLLGGLGALGKYGPKALKWGLPKVGDFIKGGGANPFSWFGKINKSLSGDSSLFKGLGGKLPSWGKFLGPVGDLSALDMIDKGNSGFWDWALGHKKGMQKDSGLFSNPFGAKQKYSDDREGAIQKAWNGVKSFFGHGDPTPKAKKDDTPKDSKLKSKDFNPNAGGLNNGTWNPNASNGGSQPSESQMTQQGLAGLSNMAYSPSMDSSMTPDQLKQLSQQSLSAEQMSQTNNATRKALIQQETLLQNTQKQNLQQQSSIYQQMQGAVGSGSLVQSGGDSGSGGGGGFWGNLWNGIKSLFGGGGTNGWGAMASNVGNGTTGSKAATANASTIYKYLTSQGLSAGAASGIMGNLMQESGLDPAKEGGGLAQWSDPGRYKNLQNYAKQTGGSPTSLNTELGFLMQELKSGSYGSISALNKMNPSQAAAYFEKNFEQAGVPALSSRENYAGNFYNQFANANVNSSPTVTHKVVVSGSINNMDSSNSSAVGQAIVQAAGKFGGVPTTNYSLGIGGFA